MARASSTVHGSGIVSYPTICELPCGTLAILVSACPPGSLSCECAAVTAAGRGCLTCLASTEGGAIYNDLLLSGIQQCAGSTATPQVEETRLSFENAGVTTAFVLEYPRSSPIPGPARLLFARNSPRSPATNTVDAAYPTLSPSPELFQLLKSKAMRRNGRDVSTVRLLLIIALTVVAVMGY